MTDVSLAVTRLLSDMNSKRSVIETALMLEATPKVASKKIVDNTFDSAILATINSIVGILGGVSLTTLLLVQFGYKTFFNSESQLIYNSPNKNQWIFIYKIKPLH